MVGSTTTTNTHTDGSTTAASSSTTTLSLHRTMNPQKLSHKTLEHHAAAPNNGGDTTSYDNHKSRTYSEPQGRWPAVLCGWRSDGRVLAVVTVPPQPKPLTTTPLSSSDGGEGNASQSPKTAVGTTSAALWLQHYAVEDLLQEWHASPAVSVVPVTGCWEETPRGAGATTAAAIAAIALVWTFRGQPHPSWPRSEHDEERQWCQENVRFPVRYPRSDYHLSYTHEELSKAGSSTHLSATYSTTIVHPPAHHSHDAVQPHVLPSAAPLSLLALVTVNRTTGMHQLSAYLHGRFPWIENLPLAPSSSPPVHERLNDEASSATASAATVQVVVSNTLSHVAVLLPQHAFTADVGTAAIASSLLVVARIPHSDAVATMAASLVALEYHLSQLEGKVTEIAAVFASSLKPLDAKLDALVTTLTRYSIAIGPADPTDPIEASPRPSHRFDSLGSCLASWIMGTTSNPSSSLASAMEQYFASVQMNDQLLVRMDQSLTVALANVETQVHRNLLAPSRVLLVHTSDVLGTILAAVASVDGTGGGHHTRFDAPVPLFGSETVDAAHRLHRTAEQLLGQAERLVAEAIDARFAIRDWVRWLRAAGSAAKARGTPANSPLHQNALQRRVPDGLVNRLLERLRRPPLEQEPQRDAKPSRPTPLRKAEWTQQVLHLNLTPNLDRIPVLTALLRDALRDVPLGPRRAALDRTHVRSYTLGTQPQDRRRRLAAITTRLGGGGCPRSRLLPRGSCFAPPGASPRSFSPKEWIVTATALGATGVPPSVALHAVPLADDDNDPIKAPIADDATAWMVRLVLGAGVCRILDLAFYGDDGKSSLSSMDGGTGHERRQALVLLVESQQPPGSGSSLELWLLPYDDCPFAPVPLSDSRFSRSEDAAVPAVQVIPQPSMSSGDGKESRRQTKDDCIYAKTRQLSSFGASSSVQLVVSGSRGVGAVLVKDQSTGTTLLDLYDLEENDGEGEDDDDSGSNGSDGMSTED